MVSAPVPAAPKVRLERLRAEAVAIRRLQTAELRLPVPVAQGHHSVDLVLGLTGVADAAYAEPVDFV